MERKDRKRRLNWRVSKANHGRKPKRGKMKSRFKAQRFRSR
jgi:hypothetical protein